MEIEIFGITIDLLNVVCTVGMVALGWISNWYKTSAAAQAKIAEIATWKAKLLDAVDALIDQAETTATLATGTARAEWVAAKLHDLLPDVIEPYIEQAWIESIVQTKFDEMDAYVTTMLDKLATSTTTTTE